MAQGEVAPTGAFAPTDALIDSIRATWEALFPSAPFGDASFALSRADESVDRYDLSVTSGSEVVAHGTYSEIMQFTLPGAD